MTPNNQTAAVQPCFISSAGSCITCELQIDDNEVIQCFVCSNNFHALCKSATNQICNKSLLACFMQKSTKRNFVWYCDVCLTKAELMNTESKSSQSQKVQDLENKIDLLSAKVDSISDVLVPGESSIVPRICSNKPSNVWKNSSKITILRNNLSGSPNLEQLEKEVVSGCIEITNSKRTSKGDVIITCPTSTAANKIKEIATTLLPGHIVKDPHVKYSWINIVGFETNHTADAVFELLVKNNYVFESLKGKSKEDAAEFLEVKLVKPCLKNQSIYRALVKVSNAIRDIISRGHDKLRIGLYNCRVYDQSPQVRRCNKCQNFGHWVSECNINNGQACAKCASVEHETRDCPDTSNPKCINCKRAGIVNFHPAHTADASDCPCFINYRKASYSSGASSVPPQQINSSNVPPQQQSSAYKTAQLPSQLSRDISHFHGIPTAYPSTAFSNTQTPCYIPGPPIQQNMGPSHYGSAYPNNYHTMTPVSSVGHVGGASHLNT